MKVHELLAALATANPEVDVLIEDADTNWPLAVIVVDVQSTYVSLGGEYHNDANPDGWPK